MDDDPGMVNMVVVATDKLLGDLTQRLGDASKSGQTALRKEALEMMGLLNQARFIYEDVKLERAKAKLMAAENERAAQSQNGAPIDPQAGDTTKQIIDGIEKQRVSLDAKLDMIAAKIDSKDDLGDLKRDIQQLRDEIHKMTAKQRQPSASLSDTLSDTDETDASTPAELSPLSGDERDRLASFRARSPMDILRRLVPTKTEEGWCPEGILLTLYKIWGDIEWAAWSMLFFMNGTRFKRWCCVRTVTRALDPHHHPKSEVQAEGTCPRCQSDCVQIMPLETDADLLSRPFRVRVMNPTYDGYQGRVIH